MRTGPISRQPSEWLGLAVAPTFAAMALLAVSQGGPTEILCSAAQGHSSLSGMVPMYVLMSVFHSAPWLRLFGGRKMCGRTSI